VGELAIRERLLCGAISPPFLMLLFGFISKIMTGFCESYIYGRGVQYSLCACAEQPSLNGKNIFITNHEIFQWFHFDDSTMDDIIKMIPEPIIF